MFSLGERQRGAESLVFVYIFHLQSSCTECSVHVCSQVSKRCEYTEFGGHISVFFLRASYLFITKYYAVSVFWVSYPEIHILPFHMHYVDCPQHQAKRKLTLYNPLPSCGYLLQESTCFCSFSSAYICIKGRFQSSFLCGVIWYGLTPSFPEGKSVVFFKDDSIVCVCVFRTETKNMLMS